MTRETDIKSLLMSGYTYCSRLYVLYFVFMLILGLAVPAFIVLQKKIIDIAANATGTESIVTLLLPFSLGYLFFYYLDTVSSQLITTLKMKIMHTLEKKVMANHWQDISQMVFETYENEETQNLLMRVSESQRIVYSQAVSFIPNIVRRLIELGAIFYFVANSGVWWAFPLGVLITLPSFYFNKRRTSLARQVWNRDSLNIRFADYIDETLLNRENAKERRFFGFQPYLSNMWNDLFKVYNKNKIKIFIKSSAATGIAMCFSMSIIVVLGLALLVPLQNGIITIGLYTSLLIAVSSKMNMGISAVIREYSNLASMGHYLQDINKLTHIPKINTKPDYNTQPLHFDNLVFDDVWFAYPNTDNYVLQGVTFKISKNEHHALIGINGAGKTTITKLILGLYSPSKGKVYVNGKDTSSYSYNQLQSLFAVTIQDFARYKDTLRGNLCLYDLGRQPPNDDKMLNTLTKCHSEEVLTKSKNSFDTMLTPEYTNGVMLSGGEWQKISIARTFYSNRDFVILDEPTAALDPNAEIRFYQTYHELMINRTCLFITHRLGSTYLFDNCYVLSEGKICEQGSHEDLMKLDGVYKQLFEKQQRWYLQPREAII